MTKTIVMTAALAASVALPVLPIAESWGQDNEIVTLDQGWDEAARNTFYHAPQGSPILPYAFFMALEQPDSTALFTDEDHFERLGMMFWGRSAQNPDGLPIGLTIDRDIHGIEPQLGMNCAACHVTEIQAGGRTVLIDGGVSHFDFWTFMERLLASLEQTYEDRAKFDRFADRLLGADLTAETKSQLHARLRGVMRMRQDWAFNNTASVHPGPGRVDALNVILNQVTAKMLDRPDNARDVNAPVSFPFLWDAPYLTHVQYNGVVPNRGAGALGRNVGQVLGVFGQVSLNESTLPGGYASSVRVDHLQDLENTLETLTSPQWSELSAQGILPEIDADLAAEGAEVFTVQCASCHTSIDRENRGKLASVPVSLLALPDVGTDPAAAMGFAARLVNSGPLKGRKEGYAAGQPMCEEVHANSILANVTVGVIMHDLGTTYKPILKSLGDEVKTGLSAKVHAAGNGIKQLFGFGESAEAKKQLTDVALIAKLRAQGKSDPEITAALEARSQDRSALYEQLVSDSLAFHGEDAACLEVLQTAQYRGRPLNGVWATGPFLHNGSVRTLADLLKPVEDRPVQFRVGDETFDPEGIGFAEAPEGEGFLFDTTLPGNSKAGHEYGTQLGTNQKAALLEYLKSI